SLRYPTGNGGETAVEFAIHPSKLHDVFAAHLPLEQATIMAATQRPVTELAFSEPIGPPTWRTLPSLAVVATGDKAAVTDVVRSIAERARGHCDPGRGVTGDHDLAAPRRCGGHRECNRAHQLRTNIYRVHRDEIVTTLT